MMAQGYEAHYAAITADVEKRLAALCDAYLPADREISRAARYSLLSGGKRVRAVLCVSACLLSGQTSALALDYACALEMLHCYSLIHDDLPCMDNDTMRRGRPSCHVAFGESTALLAADALVTAAFEVIANAPCTAESRVQAAAHLAKAGGAQGMLYGQELDKKYETGSCTEAQLYELHRNKTGALIVCAVQLGCDAAGASEKTCQALTQYAAGLGLAFQIVDDILDVTSTTEMLGKPVGSDTENGKTTFITLYGPQGAKQLAQKYTDDAMQALDDCGHDADFLRSMAFALQQRNK